MVTMYYLYSSQVLKIKLIVLFISFFLVPNVDQPLSATIKVKY